VSGLTRKTEAGTEVDESKRDRQDCSVVRAGNWLTWTVCVTLDK
jgi:hypothetical protein